MEGAELRAGLRMPLISQNEIVGLMIVHSTRRARFTPGDRLVFYTDGLADTLGADGRPFGLERL